MEFRMIFICALISLISTTNALVTLRKTVQLDGDIRMTCATTGTVDYLIMFNQKLLSDLTLSVRQNFNDDGTCKGDLQKFASGDVSYDERIVATGCTPLNVFVVLSQETAIAEDLGRWSCASYDTDGIETSTSTLALYHDYAVKEKGLYDSNGVRNDFTIKIEILDYDEESNRVALGCTSSTGLGTPFETYLYAPMSTYAITGTENFKLRGELYERESASSSKLPNCAARTPNTIVDDYNCLYTASDVYTVNNVKQEATFLVSQDTYGNFAHLSKNPEDVKIFPHSIFIPSSTFL